MPSTMKEAVVAKGPKVTIQDVPIPEPKADQVVIKVVVSGSNPKDWCVPFTSPFTMMQSSTEDDMLQLHT